MSTKISIILPLRLTTIGNTRRHWRHDAAVAKEQRTVTRMALAARLPRGHSAPYVVHLTRIGPRYLDPGNLQGCFKHVQDGIADACGIDDGSRFVVWHYAQSEQRGYSHRYGVCIDLECADASDVLETKETSHG